MSVKAGLFTEQALVACVLLFRFETLSWIL